MKTWKILFSFLVLGLFISTAISFADDELVDLSDETSINDAANEKKVEVKEKTAIPKPPLPVKKADDKAVTAKPVPTATLDDIEEDEESDEEEEEIDEDEGDVEEDEEEVKKPASPAKK